MKFFHLADLHLGKQVNGFPMLEDQSYILKQILSLADIKKPDAVLLCGDIFDKPTPPEEAVRLYDTFLYQLDRRGINTFVIPGNHDSAERLACGSRLMRQSHITIAGPFRGTPQPIQLTDGFGTLNLYMLPFIKPAAVRNAYPDCEEAAALKTYQDAAAFVVKQMQIDPEQRNVLMAHQFVTGAKRCDSEEVSVGGLDNIDAGLFHAFDYVALGHIHGPQSIGRETVRYAGTPIKYSFSEIHDQKSVTIADCGRKNTVRIVQVPLIPRRDIREISGTYAELTARPNYEHTALQDYLHVILKDEHEIPDVMNKLRVIYPNIMGLDYAGRGAAVSGEPEDAVSVEEQTPDHLFEEFFEQRNGREMTQQQKDYIQSLIHTIWEA